MSKENKIRKDIASHERNFSKGDISAGYKLYLMYEYGISEKTSDGEAKWILEKDPQLANEYLSACESKLRDESKLYISNLTLSDFRKFKDLKVKLDKQLTVIIGDNGAGKTTIIDGITKSLSWLSANIKKQGGKGRLVTEYDVNVDSLTYADVTLQASLNKNTHYSISLGKTAKGAKESYSSQLEAFEELGGLYRNIDNKNRRERIEELNLPLIVSYSVNRTNIKSNKTFNLEKISSVEFGSKYDVYDNKSVDGTGNFDDFSEWYLALYNRSGDDLSERLDNSHKRVEALRSAGADDESSEIFDIYLNAKKEYNLLKSEYENKEKYINQLRIVKHAILSTVPGFLDIFIDKSKGRAELKVKTEGREINIFQTSQGQHVFISIIADIVKKLVEINPSLDNPLLGNGIVLIDEIELHLHPKWQQNIINALIETFPNIQFIMTTHSPQVLSTVDKSCIRRFVSDEYGNMHCLPPKFQTKGVKSADILAEIMGTNSTPDVEEARKVDEFSKLLQLGKKDEALELLEILQCHFGEEHPIILDCENKIKIFEMKERISLKKNSEASQ